MNKQSLFKTPNPTELTFKMSKITLKKLIKQLAAIKGRHTELVTVYVPVGANLHEIINQLRNEQSTAENIKSKPVRKNVVSALDKIIRELQMFKKTPPNGLALFAGNISLKEGATDIEVWTIEPPDEVKVKMYWCDQNFVMEPLEDMIKEKQIYGIICLDKSEGDVALLRGKKLEPIVHYDSIVPGKTRAGGQCLAPDTLVQMGDGNITEIDKVSNPHIVKAVDFSNITLKNRPVIEKWETRKNTKYIITTKYPTTQIESSKDHTFFRWGNKIEEVPAAELKKDDFLLMPEKIGVEGEIQSLNVSCLYNSYQISEEGRNYIKNRRGSLKLLQKELAKKSNVTQTAISVIELGKRDIKIGFLRNLCKNLDVETESFIRQFCIPIKDIRLPEILNENLANFLGYFAGDGSFENERISLFDANQQIIEYYNKLSKNIFNCNSSITHRENKGHYVARIYGKPIVELIKKEFPELKYAIDTEIPVKILKSPDSVLAAFLRGFFDAEGYVNKERGIGLGINNKKMSRQVQLALLRFGVLASLVEYNNRRNPYTKKHRFTVGITERKSLEIFLNSIGFNAAYKSKNLIEIIKNKSIKSNTRQIFLTGKNVRKILESEGYKVSDFPKVTDFFRNKRLMSKEVFKNSILNEIKDNENLYKRLETVLNYNLIPVKIASIKKVEEELKMVDIEVKNSNFIANGLVVHNSSQRFSRVREGMLNDWLKKMGEAANKIFEEHKAEVIGIIVSGSGPIKEMFMKEDYLHADVKKKVIGIIDTSYTGEFGLQETIEKSDTLLKEEEVTKEKKLLQDFFNELQKPHGRVSYGIHEVVKSTEAGAVDRIIVSEATSMRAFDLINPQTQEKKVIFASVKPNESGWDLMGEKDLPDFLEELADNYGSKVIVVSNDTREGQQFLELGGVGALLRYNI